MKLSWPSSIPTDVWHAEPTNSAACHSTEREENSRPLIQDFAREFALHSLKQLSAQGIDFVENRRLQKLSLILERFDQIRVVDLPDNLRRREGINLIV